MVPNKIIANIGNKLGLDSQSLQQALKQLPKSIDTFKNVTPINDASLGLKFLEQGKLGLPKASTEKPVVAALRGKAGSAVNKGNGLFSNLKIAKGGRILAMSTNTLMEVSKAVNQDYQKGTFIHTPKAILKEGFGWLGATAATIGATIVTRNPTIAQSAALAGYSFGAHVAEKYPDDVSNYYDAMIRNPQDDIKKSMAARLTWIGTGVASPVLAPYLYARMEEHGWI